MTETPSLYRRTIDRLKDAKLTVTASIGVIAVNALCGDADLAVHSTDSIAKQMEMAIPSAFGTPEATGVKALDFGGCNALTMACLEGVRRTSSLAELGATAVTAQLVGCGTDALVDQTGFVGDTTDVGSSAIAVAWATKFFLDKAASAEDDTKRRHWKLGGAAFAAVMTVGAYAFLGGDDGKLDLISHCSALAVGAGAYHIGAWRKEHKNTIVDDSILKPTLGGLAQQPII